MNDVVSIIDTDPRLQEQVLTSKALNHSCGKGKQVSSWPDYPFTNLIVLQHA